MGIGYALPTVFADRNFFLGRSFARMRASGLHTLWLLDLPLTSPTQAVWSDIVAQVTNESGFLLGYLPLFRTADYFRVGQRGVPVLLATNSYADTPAALAQRVQNLLALPEAQRPAVTFFSASVWNNQLDDLVTALEPLQSDGARFLLPSQALSCVP